jgi:molybdopterin-guanine dinucleotide biosynthesis protein A
MPFLSTRVVQALFALLTTDEATSPLAAVPRTADGPEPLCALWRREAAPAIRSALDAGERSPMRLLARLPVAWLEGEALSAIGDPNRLFQNCNTPAEYAAALAKEGAP